MKGVTKAMGQMNRQMNLPSLQKIMQEFERQNERMELTTEVMGDAIDDALEGDEEEEETEELVSQVLDEIGIDVNQEVILLVFPFFFLVIALQTRLLSLCVKIKLLDHNYNVLTCLNLMHSLLMHHHLLLLHRQPRLRFHKWKQLVLMTLE